MTSLTHGSVLADTFGARDGTSLLVKQIVLVIVGIAALAIAAKIRVPVWPVPMTMQTFAVLTIGAAYGTRLGLATLIGYIAIGALGVPVFAGDSAGLAYLAGPTAGYLVGFAVAAGVVGSLARRGWDRSVGQMALALLIGNAIIYGFGLPWMAYLFLADKGAGWVMQWGMTNFLIGDGLKLVLAALLIPAVWKLVGSARG